MNQKLFNGITKFYNEVVKLKSHETLLILATDEGNGLELAQTFYSAAKSFTNHITMITNPARNYSNEMEKITRQALLSEPDVFIITNLYKEGADKFGDELGYDLNGSKIDWLPRYLQLAKKSRGFWMTPNSDLDVYADALDIDYSTMKILNQKLIKEFNKAVKILIKDKNGTNLTIDIRDKTRKPIAECDDTQDQPGSGINIPTGEILIFPVMGKSEGIAYIDMEFYAEDTLETIMLDQPIKIEFENGIIKNVTGGDGAERFNKIIEKAKLTLKEQLDNKTITKFQYNERIRNSLSISEFAFGVHPGIKKITKELLFDEKIYGTCHIAFGSSYDGDAAPYHSDFIFSMPEVYFDYGNGEKKLICKDREFFV